jgi:hypothetical protein
MRPLVLSVLCVGLVLVAADRASAACAVAGKVLLQDQFRVLSKNWGRLSNYHVENGEMLITPPAGFNTTTLNRSKLPADLDVCVETNIKPSARSGTCAGIVFWGIDFDNYYSFQYSNDGKASFWRRQRGKWLSQVGAQPVANIGPDVPASELGMTIRGSHARLFVNGQFFREVTGDPAKGATKIGLIACAPDKAAAIVAFDNLIVTPAAPEPSSGGSKETKTP